MAGVSIRNVKKIYPGGFEAIHGASIEIPDKSFTVLVGPSGCGKSTLLRMIAGLEAVSEGDILIGEKRVNDIPPKDRDIAMVFQNYALYPHMSVFENMAFGIRLRGVPKDEIRRRVADAAEILGLTELLERKPQALSGGQRQRVAVGRAIVRKPKVFLFDEPLSNLDAKLRVQMRAEISLLHTKLQATMIYVTHDQVEAMTMGDQIVVLNAGDIMQIDSPLELYHRPENLFVAGFIGSPAMNFLECGVEERNGEIFMSGADFSLRAAKDQAETLSGRVGERVLLGIRPEDIYDRLFTPQAPADRSATATVEVVEPMGAETFVHFTLGGGTLTARFDTDEIPAVQQKIGIVFDMEKTLIFDPKSGLRLKKGSGAER